MVTGTLFERHAPRRVTLTAYLGDRVVASVSWQSWVEFDASWAQTIAALREIFGHGTLSWVVSVPMLREHSGGRVG